MSYVSIIQKLPQEFRPVMLELVETVEQNMRVQYAVRREDFDNLRASVLDLAQAQQRTEQRVSELAEAQQRTEQRISELTEAQQRTEQRVHELTEVQRQMLVAQTRFETRLGKFDGRQLESLYRERAPAYLGRILRRIRVISYQELEETLEQHLSEDELDEVRLLDLVVRGRPKITADAPEVWLAVEVSTTIDRHDVERAQRRAMLLRRAGYLAVPVAAGEEKTKGATELAATENVVLVENGLISHWEAALTQVLE